MSATPISPYEVGSYLVREEIARGGMACVYLAEQPALERKVALKELGVFPLDNGTFAERFLLESRVAGSLAHPNAVTVYDFFEWDGRPYIAMEYLARGSLRGHMDSLSLAQIAGVLEGLLAGLAHAESRRVVHRDLKPENVLVTDDGSVKIADFGIAKAYSQVCKQMTKTGTAVGTPLYMAPEQAQGFPVDGRTDLYALGTMTYELLLRQTPFPPDDEPMALLMKQISAPVPDPRELDPEMDSALAAWLLAMLAKDPEARPASALAAWNSFEDIAVRLLGPTWRRDARLLDADHPARSKPLSEAEFPSLAPPAPEPSYRTYQDRVASPPTPLPEPPGPTGPIARAGEPAETPGAWLPPAQPSADPPPEPAPSPEPAGSTNGRPQRRVRRRIATAVAGLALVGGGTGAAVALGGTDRPLVDMARVESQVRTALGPLYAIETLRCPTQVAAAPGASFPCTATLAGGQTMSVIVHQIDRTGRVTAEPRL